LLGCKSQAPLKATGVKTGGFFSLLQLSNRTCKKP
jgi:hypothetical protein